MKQKKEEQSANKKICNKNKLRQSSVFHNPTFYTIIPLFIRKKLKIQFESFLF